MSELIGKSKAFTDALDYARKIAKFEVNIWLSGESGTGKEVIAKLIRNESARKEKPFVAVNCGAIPNELVDSELFGYVKGAFTGANTDKAGFIETANDGVLLLDEICDLPLATQIRLLRVIETGEFYRIGARKPSQVNVRWFAASHKDAASEITAGKFRLDLFYRLAEITLHLPSLREREHDVVLYVESLLAKLNAENNGRVLLGNESDILALDFAGNFRGIKNQVTARYVDAFPRGILFPVKSKCDACDEVFNGYTLIADNDGMQYCKDCYASFYGQDALNKVKACNVCNYLKEPEHLTQYHGILACENCKDWQNNPLLAAIHGNRRSIENGR